jgi:putative ATPase
MKELGFGREYKYNPDYAGGRVAQEYLPERLEGREFLGKRDLGEKVDPDLGMGEEEAGKQGEGEMEGVVDDDLDGTDDEKRGNDEGEEEEILLGPDGD